MSVKPNIRSALRLFLTCINPGIAIALMVFALSARHLDMNHVFRWLGPEPVYADDGNGGGGDHDGDGGGGDHDGGDHGGDYERGSDTGDHGEGNDPADIGSDSGSGNGPDQTSNQFSGLEGIHDLTPPIQR